MFFYEEYPSLYPNSKTMPRRNCAASPFSIFNFLYEYS